MPPEYLTDVPLETAKTEYLRRLIQNGMAAKTETIPVTSAAGRVTAAPVYARIYSPHYNACAMDGIAVAAALTSGACAETPVTLADTQFKRVNTGDPLPIGCDAVVMIEKVVEDGGFVKLFEPASPWQHVRQIGEDICAGDMLLPSGSRISPASLGAMIAGGLHEIDVIKRPLAGIIPTGDEIVPLAADPKDGETPELNSAIFSAMLREWGAETVTYPIVKDNPGLLRTAILNALQECDIVVVNAGSSAGNRDYAADVLAETGEIFCHGLAIKPGRPAILGLSGAKPVLGVPGSPVSGIIVIQELLRPIVEFLCRTSVPPYNDCAQAKLSKAIVSTPEYREFVRVRVGGVDGRLIATPLSRGGGVVTSFMKADGIVEVPQGVEKFENGASVNINLLRPLEDVMRSVVVIGSHDPLLDELNELLSPDFRRVSLSSAHVGSMAGLMAVRRGEAHIAGTHLLDEKTGEYNVSFIKRYFPDGGVRLVECVGRTQGLIAQSGNPKGIEGVSCLTRDGVRYVNRQKGSGTRILLDYLCRRGGVDTAKIQGYDREEYTHTSVAALVANGSADAGLGVFSAAKMYGLHFTPVCDEQYDLLIPDYAWQLPSVQELLTVIRSDAFRRRLDALGGYTLANPGTVREVF